MYVSKVVLKNFRGFENFEASFAEGFNLIAGFNGAGKTSLLTGIARGLYALAYASDIRTSWPFLPEKDVRQIPSGTEERRQFARLYPCSCSVFLNSQNTTAEETTALFSHTGGTLSNKEAKGPLVHSIKAGLTASGEKNILPLLLFFGAERHWANLERKANELASVVEKTERISAYKDWFSGKTDVSAFIGWFVSNSMVQLQRQSENKDTSNDDLHVLTAALRNFLPNLKSLRYDFSEKELIIEREEKESAKQKTTFGNLSDGEKEILCLFAEIVRRMTVLNPQLAGMEVIQKTPGVVLIDELDLHLHPVWQRRIVGALKKSFPRLQFIATSHSPQIIAELKPQEVLVLGETPHHPEKSYGLNSNAVLRGVMGATDAPAAVSEAVTKIYALIDAEDFDGAEKHLSVLRQSLDGDTEDTLRLQTLIDAYR